MESSSFSSYPKRRNSWLGFVVENKAERFNTLSAFSGAMAAVFGVVWLVAFAVRQGDLWKITSFSIFGFTLISVYVLATLYHGSEGRAKAVFSKLDHLSIYLLIAGTYTPFTLVTLRESVGWQVFVAIWGMACFGIILDLTPKNRNRVLRVIICLAMGWLIIVALDPLLRAMPIEGFYCLLLGGLFYTIGVLFYALDEKVSYFHGIWHLFVMAGSFNHYVAVLYYVA
ncbi:hemolysin III family protein [Methylococcus sp. Mc7]|uniref:PAQR family membrane homeostasis protein TrhA n=1 Tax=Methylococcus sp. Mc7 TaxID=2860258 RepID=UPI001C52C415|nr:hemolysin III family protein [Methylococcus sp. Mc7]QXP83249.1 hemolysin III family protein [Methylococcus sp. Mc7]